MGSLIHMRNLILRYTILCCSLLTVIMIGACSDDNTGTPSKAGTFAGGSKNVGDGKATSWVKWDDNGNPTSVGVTFSENAFKNLPDTGLGTEYELTMPTQASATGIDHISVDWNPHGHEPAGIYDAPHFDIHFYYLNTSELMGITLGKDTVVPASMYVPANYITDSTAVPMMGVHWVDITSGEFHGKAFDKTFIYGFSKGKLAFLEPMITKAFFDSKPSVTVNIPQPQQWQTSNRYYPATYSVKYNATAKEYTVTLDGFVKK